MAIAVERFNSNVSYSGLLHAVTGDVSVLNLSCLYDFQCKVMEESLVAGLGLF